MAETAAEQSADQLLGGPVLLWRRMANCAFGTRFFGRVAYAGLPYRRRRIHAQAAEVPGNHHIRAYDRPEILALHYFVAGHYDKAMEYGWRAGERAMARYAPAGAAGASRRGGPGCPTFPERQPERAFVLPGGARAMPSTWRAGRPRLPSLPRGASGGAWSAPAGGSPGAQTDPRRATPRPLQQALRRASLGLRAVSGLTGPEAGAVRARLQVPTRSAGSTRVAMRMPADGRSEPRRSRGGQRAVSTSPGAPGPATS